LIWKGKMLIIVLIFSTVRVFMHSVRTRYKHNSFGIQCCWWSRTAHQEGGVGIASCGDATTREGISFEYLSLCSIHSCGLLGGRWSWGL